ncbi:recombination hotspot-binding protein [Ascodesmis nigricans]|uniref:Recombination hotspot-binding protein n=1 Tax=Ascodesmis nigricans TaxID=341454 RepID=A0A4S2MZM4_9PEZI|nr:recombination hotspot-binding protein [Ascodesmis nigricans]
MTHTAIDHSIFTAVQEQIENDAVVRENIREALKKLDKEVKVANAVLTRVHSVPPSEVPRIVATARPHLSNARKELHALVQLVEAYPYYKYNGLWTRDLQNLTFLVLFATWLERMYEGDGEEAKEKKPEKEHGNALLTLEEAGNELGVPVNLKTEDKFHLTIEEYLHAVITLVEELTRLTTNAVIQRDFERPMLISKFVKDLFSAFQVLNLKNDSLRRRGDSLKYSVKKVEDITYDLAVRNLVPVKEEPQQQVEGDAKMETD